MNWVTRRKAVSIRPNISFKVSESRCSSSPVFNCSRRLLRLEPVMLRAVRVMASTGDKALPLTQYPTPDATRRINGANIAR